MRKIAGVCLGLWLVPGVVYAQTCYQADSKHPDSVALVWTDNSTDESGFILERKQDAGAYTVLAAALNANLTSYTDSSIKRGTAPVTYTYRVQAYRDSDKAKSPYSNEACITFAPAALPPLAAPAGLTLSGITQTEIQASWEDTPNETGYRLVLTSGTPPVTLVNYPAKDAVSYTRSGLTKNKTFCGVLYATASGVESPPSQKSCATTKR